MLISLFFLNNWKSIINKIFKICSRKGVGGGRENIYLINAYSRKIDMSDK